MSESVTTKLGEEPRYLLADAAILADVPKQTLRSWVQGWRETNKRKAQPACIRLDCPLEDPICLSFFNTLEAGFLAAYRNLGVPMQRIRPALDYAKKRLNIQRPLLHETFRVNGKDLFVEFQEESGFKRLVNVSKSGQTAWPELVNDYFRSIEYDKHGPILRWLFGIERPFVGINPAIAFGSPCIIGRGVTTDVIVGRFQARESHEEIAEDFSITTVEVEEALRWETESLRRRAA